MSRRIITFGMDVHKESITLAVLPDGAPAPIRIDRLPIQKLKAQGAVSHVGNAVVSFSAAMLARARPLRNIALAESVGAIFSSYR